MAKVTDEVKPQRCMFCKATIVPTVGQSVLAALDQHYTQCVKAQEVNNTRALQAADLVSRAPDISATPRTHAADLVATPTAKPKAPADRPALRVVYDGEEELDAVKQLLDRVDGDAGRYAQLEARARKLADTRAAFWRTLADAGIHRR